MRGVSKTLGAFASGKSRWAKMGFVETSEPEAGLPPVLELGTGRVTSSYELASDLVAIYRADPSPAAVAALEGGVSVEPREATLGSAGRQTGPVYRQKTGGQVAVPTGRILVRFPAGDRADRHLNELAAAGYEVEQVLSYAPQAAWVRAATGRITDALRHIDDLTSIEGIEHVEPQLLTQRATRR